MDTKAAFEKWCSEKGYSTEQFHYGNWACQYKLESVRNKWDGWQASRAAIEIELPEEFHSESWLGNGCCDDYANTKIAECRKAITSHGIRIKGKRE